MLNPVGGLPKAEWSVVPTLEPYLAQQEQQHNEGKDGTAGAIGTGTSSLFLQPPTLPILEDEPGRDLDAGVEAELSEEELAMLRAACMDTSTEDEEDSDESPTIQEQNDQTLQLHSYKQATTRAGGEGLAMSNQYAMLQQRLLASSTTAAAAKPVDLPIPLTQHSAHVQMQQAQQQQQRVEEPMGGEDLSKSLAAKLLFGDSIPAFLQDTGSSQGMSSSSETSSLTGSSQQSPYDKQQLCRFSLQGLSNYLSRGGSQVMEQPASSLQETLDALRAEPVDTKVQQALDILPRRTMVELIRSLCFNPELVQTLCEKERGKIVTQVIASMKGEGCECLVDTLTNNIHHLATHRVGCVSLSRAYDALMTYKRPLSQSTAGQKKGARKKAAAAEASGPVGVNRSGKNGPSGVHEAPSVHHVEPIPTRSILHFIYKVLSVFPDLACHPQGNFVCSAILSPGSPKEAFSGVMRMWEENPPLFLQLAGDKSGSHIVDGYSNNADADGLKQLVRFLQTNTNIITSMAKSDIGNYPLQNILKNAVKKLTVSQPTQVPNPALFSLQQPAPAQNCPELIWLQTNVPNLTKQSHHFSRITNALGVRQPQQQVQQQQPPRMGQPAQPMTQPVPYYQHPPQQQPPQPLTQGVMLQQPQYPQHPQFLPPQQASSTPQYATQPPQPQYFMPPSMLMYNQPHQSQQHQQ